MDRSQAIEAHKAQVAEENYIEPKDVAVFDIENAQKIEHVWVHRGIQSVCESPTHPRHVAWARQPM